MERATEFAEKRTFCKIALQKYSKCLNALLFEAHLNPHVSLEQIEEITKINSHSPAVKILKAEVLIKSQKNTEAASELLELLNHKINNQFTNNRVAQLLAAISLVTSSEFAVENYLSACERANMDKKFILILCNRMVFLKQWKRALESVERVEPCSDFNLLKEYILMLMHASEKWPKLKKLTSFETPWFHQISQFEEEWKQLNSHQSSNQTLQ